MTVTVVSAPGKVLVGGGYLVLDQKYNGTVLSTSSRFYTIIKQNDSDQIRVRSPQFVSAEWVYQVKVGEGSMKISDKNINKNKFVQLALQSTLSLVAEIRNVESIQSSLDIIVLGDNDFYSQRENLVRLHLPRTFSSLVKIPPFASVHCQLQQVHKTGLGSSAALITSLVSALLVHFGIIVDLDNEQSRRLAHNLAQYVHCRAQGKVGSGFDVAAAVFGSMIYTRFNPKVLSGLMKDSGPLYPVLKPSNPNWDQKIQHFSLPPLTRLLLADVDAGSDTPSLVGQVLRWRTDEPDDASLLWTELDNINRQFVRTLSDLSECYEQNKEHYIAAVNHLASLRPTEWPLPAPPLSPEEITIASKFYSAHCTSQTVRQKMREMGEVSDVPIEPPSQTLLLDTCTNLAGVIGGGVPGAGGYDAIWLLVCDPPQIQPDIVLPATRVEGVWSTYQALDVSPLSAVVGANGLRVENLDDVPGLKEAARLA